MSVSVSSVHYGIISVYNIIRLRQCRLEERSIISTKLAYHMQSHEFNDFWKEIRKQNKAKSALSNCVAGVTGETAIADMWRDHYEELLNSTASSHEKEDILEHFKSISSHVGMQVTMLEICKLLRTCLMQNLLD